MTRLSFKGFTAAFVILGGAYISDAMAEVGGGVRHELLDYGRSVFPTGTDVTWHHYVEMSDGVKIAATVIRPPSPGPHPAIVVMSPYGDSHSPYSNGLYRTPIPDFVHAGYAVVAVDWRGTGCSGGRRDLGSERFKKDGYELIEWIAVQPWSTDKVGMGGASARGNSTWFVAASNPPSLAAIAPQTYYADTYNDSTHRGGIKTYLAPLVWGFVAQPTLDAQVLRHGDKTCFQNRKHHTRDDAIEILTSLSFSHDGAEWAAKSIYPLMDDITAPVLSFQAAYDRYQPANGIWRFNDIKSPKRFLMSPGGHSLSRMPEAIDEMIRWFDYWLKGIGNGVSPNEESVVVYFDVRETQDAAAISRRGFKPAYAREFAAWPPHELEPLSFNLQAGGTLVTDKAKRGKASYAFSELPEDLAIVGGAVRPANFEFAKPWQEFGKVEDAGLTYVSEPLETDLELVGAPRLDLKVKVSTVDTDLFAFLSEVHPNGDVTYIKHVALRASHREVNEVETERQGRVVRDHARSLPLKPGKTYDIPVQFSTVTHRVQKESRIRLDLVPAWVMTAFFGLDYMVVPYSGEITVLSGGDVSKLTLPVVGRGGPDLPPPPACGERPDQPCRKAHLIADEAGESDSDLFERNP